MTQPGGGSFAVDVAQAPKAIRELEDARRELESIRNDAARLGQVRPPTTDQVSLDAARALGMTATGGNGSLTQALSEGIRQITTMIESLRTGFQAYQEEDQESRRQLDSQS